MKSNLIFKSRVETRNKPINLRDGDLSLFEHEFSSAMEETYAFKFNRVNILNNLLFTPNDFKFYPSLSEITEVTQKSMLKKLKYFFRPTEFVEDGLWIIDGLSSEYFHWLTDALPRLIAIEELREPSGLEGKYKIILPKSYQSKSYISDSLNLLGYDVFYYNPSRRLKIRNLITVSHTAPTGNYNSEIIRELRKKLMKISVTANRKIYISRQKAVRRKIINEAAIIEVLNSLGYEIHCFEDYNLGEQINIMGQASSLVGLHGAGLTNMLFMPAGSKVLELRNGRDSHNNCFFSLTSSLGHDYYYLTNEGDTDDTYSVNIKVAPDQLREALELMEIKNN